MYLFRLFDYFILNVYAILRMLLKEKYMSCVAQNTLTLSIPTVLQYLSLRYVDIDI